MAEFLKIDGADIDLKTALQWRIVVDDDEFVEETVKDVAVIQYCKGKGISVSAEDIKNVFAELRYAKGLESAEETENWIKSDGLSESAVAQACEIIASRNALRLSISDEEVREVFVEEQASFDIAEVYNITVDDEDLANEIISQIGEQADSFYNLAVEHSIDEETYLKAGYMGEVTRNDVRAEAESLIFAATSGSVVGPVLEDDQYTVYMVRNVVKPEYEDVKDMLRDRLFEELIEDLPGTVRVEILPLGTATDPVDPSDEVE
jgi:parvulin-like peptidyl-prolyl isomerase